MCVCVCVCVCVSGSAPWWKRWYLMGRGTQWSWRGRETEIHWRSAEVFAVNIYLTCSRWWLCEEYKCVFVCVPVWVWHQRDRRQGGVGAGHVRSGVRWERPEQPGPNRHQRNPREGQQVGQSLPCLTQKRCRKYFFPPIFRCLISQWLMSSDCLWLKILSYCF